MAGHHLIPGLVLLGALVLPAAARAQAQPAADQRRESTSSAALLAEPHALGRTIEFAGRVMTSGDGGEEKNGFYPETSNMISGAGWLAIGPGYRQWLFGERVFVDASAAISWRAYKMAQARFELPALARSRIALGSQVRWQNLTQVTYFGAGADSAAVNRSEYRLKSANVVGYATYRPARPVAVTGRIGWLAAPGVGGPTGTFRRGHPDTRLVFPDDPVYQRVEQPDFLYGEASIAADTRDHRGYPSRGGLYRAAWARYSDRDAGGFSFQQYDAEAAHFVPLARRRVVIALHGWLISSDVAAGSEIPFYLQPSLGGASTLRSYSNYRFHDRHLALVNVESRIAIFTHLDGALFVDAGNVAHRVEDLDLKKTSYGLGVRVHSRRSTLARVDVARGTEGWQVLFRMNDPFRFARVSRRTAAAPFVP
jgi:hypothetical protein